MYELYNQKKIYREEITMVNWLKRRVLPLILAVAMLASYLPVSAFAEGDDNTKTLEVQAGPDQKLGYTEISNEFGLQLLSSDGGSTYKIFDSNGTQVFPTKNVSYSGNIFQIGSLLALLSDGWSNIPAGDYTLQKGTVEVTWRSYSTKWETETIPFKVKRYSNLHIDTVNLPEGTPSGITINGETATDAKLYDGESATLAIPDVEGYTYTVDGAALVEGEKNTYTVAYQDQPQTNVTVTYSPAEAATVQVASEDATVQVNGSNYTDGMQVAANSEVTLTIKPAANKYVSAVTVNGEDKAVSFNSDTDTYTAKFQAGAGNTTDQVVVTSNLIIPTDALEIPYISGKTTADDVKGSIQNLLASSPVSSEIKVKVKQDIWVTDVWLDLTGNTLENLEKNTTLRLVYDGDAYPASTVEVSYTLVDPRAATSIKIANDNLVLSYDPSLTAEDVLNQLGVSVVDGEGKVVDGADVTIDNEFPLAVGTTTVNLTYAGDDTHGKSTAVANVTVNKGDANLTVGSTIVKYDPNGGVNASDLITVDPEGVQRVEVVVGFGADDNHGTAATAYVNLPFSIPDVVVNGLAALGIDISKPFTVSGLQDVLPKILDLLNDYNDTLGGWLGTIDTTALDAVVNMLKAVQNLPSIDSVSISLRFNEDIVLKNAGGYLVAGIVSDPNYNQSMNVGAVGIVPDTQYVELAFKNSISNGIITPDLVTDEYMAAYVKDLDPEDYVNTQVGNIFFGVQDGAFYVDNKASSTVGGYVQIAYLLDVDNTISYALPIARAYAVVPDTAKIVFEGDTEVTYNGQYTPITAKVVDDNGDAIEDATPTLYFAGIQSDGKLYSAQTQPENAGYYTVTATYANDNHTLIAANITTLTIKPAESSITVNDQVYTYDGNSVNVSDMIQASPKEANVAVMVASLSAADGKLSNISGTVNIDMPAYVDEVLKKVIPDVYENGLNVETVKKSITDLQTSMKNAGLDGSFLDYVLEMVDQLPSNVNLTFKDGVTCSDVGVYLVTASVFDPNYQFNIDTGILVIAPEVTEADLAWNSEISGGVLTTPMLHDFDFDAQALVDGEKDEDISERIQYLYFGVDVSGNVIMDTNPSNLTNGIYTEIAYILEDGTSIAVAKPIVRTFVVHAQDVDVDFLDENGNVSNGGLTVVYDGEPQDVTVRVSDNGTVITPTEGTLTVSYTGVDSLGRFYSDTKAPTQTGYYTVFASYVERDADGELQRVGANITTLTIEPGDATFSLKDTTVDYDGTAKQVTVENPQNLDYITVVVDKDNNVNVVFPASWNVPAKSYDIAQGIDTILATLDKLSGNTNTRSTTLLDNLRQILNSIQIKTLQFNGAYPVNIGTYKFSALAFSENYKPVTASATLTIQEKPVTPTEPSNPGDSGNTGNTQTVTSSGSSSSDNQTQSTPAPTATVTIPQTGDTMPVGLLIGLVVAAAVALTVLVVVRKRKRN